VIFTELSEQKVKTAEEKLVLQTVSSESTPPEKPTVEMSGDFTSPSREGKNHVPTRRGELEKVLLPRGEKLVLLHGKHPLKSKRGNFSDESPLRWFPPLNNALRDPWRTGLPTQ